MNDLHRAGAPNIPLRDYAVALYGREGVSSACLMLQARTQVDVNVLLFAAWATDAGRILPADSIRAARVRVREWHEEIVRAMRTVRQRLKSGPPPAPSDATASLRERLKALEIEAELIELDQLASCIGALEPNEAVRAPLRERVTQVLTLVVVDAAGREPDKDETAAIHQVAAACEAYAAEAGTREMEI